MKSSVRLPNAYRGVGAEYLGTAVSAYAAADGKGLAHYARVLIVEWMHMPMRYTPLMPVVW
jgi:hypothetical protein